MFLRTTLVRVGKGCLRRLSRFADNALGSFLDTALGRLGHGGRCRSGLGQGIAGSGRNILHFNILAFLGSQTIDSVLAIVVDESSKVLKRP